MKATTAYVTADVETVLGRERRPFDANQANYHLEAGLRIRAGNHLVIPFFHHVATSLTAQRPGSWTGTSWAAATGTLPQALPLTGRYAASVGHTVEAGGPSDTSGS